MMIRVCCSLTLRRYIVAGNTIILDQALRYLLIKTERMCCASSRLASQPLTTTIFRSAQESSGVIKGRGIRERDERRILFIHPSIPHPSSLLNYHCYPSPLAASSVFACEPSLEWAAPAAANQECRKDQPPQLLRPLWQKRHDTSAVSWAHYVQRPCFCIHCRADRHAVCNTVQACVLASNLYGFRVRVAGFDARLRFEKRGCD